MTIASINPATGETLRRFDPHGAAEVEARLQRAAETFRTYRRTSFAERAKAMNRAADILDAEKDALGRLMVAEMGKTLGSAVQEAAKCARGCRYYATHAERFLADEPVATEAARSFVRYQPIGPVLAVMPWNFPFWQVFRFAAPALMAGNVGLLKHASNVPQCALAIEDVLRRAGFPAGAFQTLLVGAGEVARIIADRRVAAVTVTGSRGAGAAVASAAALAVKKTVLELGGSDPFVVMPTADLDAAVRAAVQARIINNGQSCIAAKRFIVAAPIAAEFGVRFVRAMAALRVGDPMDPATELGPLATADQLATVADQVDRAVRDGARLLTGGTRLGGPGYYYAPTVLVDVPPGAPAYHEEVFGPVAMLFRAADLDDAVRLANDTPFGLGASVWTHDATERERLIDAIDSGMVFVNGMVVSDPRLPFGGVKESGYGRELGVYGIHEFVNVKSVWIENAAAATSATE